MVRLPHDVRRVLATVTALWFLVFGLIGASHEARVAHVIDAQTGSVLHAPALTGSHTNHQSDVHPSDAAAEHDVCAMAQALHQASSVSVACTHVSIAPELVVAADPIAERTITTPGDVYRLAPKTSPPRIA